LRIGLVLGASRGTKWIKEGFGKHLAFLRLVENDVFSIIPWVVRSGNMPRVSITLNSQLGERTLQKVRKAMGGHLYWHDCLVDTLLRD